MKNLLQIKKPIYAFIDAANLFYNGKQSLGWNIDYAKLFSYLKEKYKVEKIYYYGGVEIYNYKYSVLDYKPINLFLLEEYLNNKLQTEKLNEAEILILYKHLKKISFYKKLAEFGYELKLKPVKIYHDENGNTTKKANCDVDMTFDLMKYLGKYSGVIVLSGDGDFVPVLSYLKHKNRTVTILARSERTAKDIKKLAGSNFRDFHYLREKLKYENNNQK